MSEVKKTYCDVCKKEILPNSNAGVAGMGIHFQLNSTAHFDPIITELIKKSGVEDICDECREKLQNSDEFEEHFYKCIEVMSKTVKKLCGVDKNNREEKKNGQ